MKNGKSLSFTRRIVYIMLALLACIALTTGVLLRLPQQFARTNRGEISAYAESAEAQPLRNYTALEVTLRNEGAILYSGLTTGANIKSNLLVKGTYYAGQGNAEAELYPLEYVISIDGKMIGDNDVVDVSVPGEEGESATLPGRVNITVDCGRCAPQSVNMDVADQSAVPAYDSIRVEVPKTAITNDHTAATLKNIITVYGITGAGDAAEEIEIVNKDLISVTINTPTGEIGTATSVWISVTYLAGARPTATAQLNTSATAILESVSVAVDGKKYTSDEKGYYKDEDGNAAFHTNLTQQEVSERISVTVFYPNAYYELERDVYSNGSWSTLTGESFALRNNSFEAGENVLNVQVTGRAGTSVEASVAVNFESVQVDRITVSANNLGTVTMSTIVTNLIRDGKIVITAKNNLGEEVPNYINYTVVGNFAPTGRDIKDYFESADKDNFTYAKTIVIQDNNDNTVKAELTVENIQFTRPIGFESVSNVPAMQSVYSPLNYGDATVNFKITNRLSIPVPLQDIADYVTVTYYTDDEGTIEASEQRFVTLAVKSVEVSVEIEEFGLSAAVGFFPITANRATMALPVSSTVEQDFTQGLQIGIDQSEYNELVDKGWLTQSYSKAVAIAIETPEIAELNGNVIHVKSGGVLRFTATLLDPDNWDWPSNLIAGVTRNGNVLTYTIQINRGEFDVRLDDVSTQYGTAASKEQFNIVGRNGGVEYTFGEGGLDIGVTLWYYGWSNWTYNNPTRNAPTAVGTYYVIAVTDDTPAYITSKTTSGNAARLTITPKEVSAESLKNIVYYNRQGHEVTEFFDYSKDFYSQDFLNGKAPVTLSGDAGPYVHVTEKGYTVTLTITSPNYIWVGENVSADGKETTVVFNLTQYKNTLQATMNDFTFGAPSVAGAKYTASNPFYGTVGTPKYYRADGTEITAPFSEWPAGNYYVEYEITLAGTDTALDVYLPTAEETRAYFTVKQSPVNKITIAVDGGKDQVPYNGKTGYAIVLGNWNEGNFTAGIIGVAVQGTRRNGTGFTETVDSLTGRILLTQAATYEITVTIEDKNYRWSDGSEAAVTYNTFAILPQSLTIVTEDDADTTYDGSVKTYRMQNLPAAVDLHGDALADVLSYAVAGVRHDGSTKIDSEIGGNISSITAVQAGTYTITVTLEDTLNYEWNGDAPESFTWVIAKAQLASVSDPATGEYGGNVQMVTLGNWNAAALRVKTVAGITFDGGTIATAAAAGNLISVFYAGHYTFTVEITDPQNFEWTDGTTADRIVAYTMNRATLSVEWGNTSFIFTGSAQAPAPAVTSGTIEESDAIVYDGHTAIYTDAACSQSVAEAIAAQTYYLKILGFEGKTIEGQTFTTAANYVLPAGVSQPFVIEEFSLDTATLYVPGSDSEVKLSGSTLLYADYRGAAFIFGNYVRNYNADELVLTVTGDGVLGDNAGITDVLYGGTDVIAYTVYVYPNVNYRWNDAVTGLVEYEGHLALQFSFRVDPLEVALDWSGDMFVYDGAEKTPSVEITNVKNADDVAVAIGDRATAQALAATAAGRYTAYAMNLIGERAFNYKVTETNDLYEHPFVIRKASVIKPTAAQQKGDYTAEQQTISFTGGENENYWDLFTGKVDGNNPWLTSSISVSGGSWNAGIFTFINAGDYTFAFTLKDSANYCWADEAAAEQENFEPANYSCEYENYIRIERWKIAPPSFTAEDRNLRAQEYTGGVLSPAAVLTGDNVLDYTTHAVLSHLSYTVAYSKYKGTPATPDSIERNEYTVTLMLNGDSALNYEWLDNTLDTDRDYVSKYYEPVYTKDEVSAIMYYVITFSQLTLDVSVKGYTYGDIENVDLTDLIAQYISVGGVDQSIYESGQPQLTVLFYRGSIIADANLLTGDHLHNGFPKNAGTYAVKIKIEFAAAGFDYQAPEYNLTNERALVVAQKVIGITWGTTGEGDYSGAEQIRGATLNNPSFGDSIGLTVGLTDGENATLAGTTKNGIPVNVKRGADHSVEAYQIAVVALTGDAAENYTIEGAIGNANTYTVNPVELTIQANGQTISYGYIFDTAVGFGYTITDGQVGAAPVQITVTGNPYILESTSGVAYVVGAEYGGAGAGYRVRLALEADQTVVGFTAQNYTILQDSGAYNGVTIEKKEITLTVRHGVAYSLFGDPILSLDPAALLSAGAGVLVAGDTLSNIDISLATTAVSDGSVRYDVAGAYTIGFAGDPISDATELTNYSVTLVNGAGAYEIRVKEVSVVWEAKSFTYNGAVQTIGNIAYYIDTTHDESSRKVYLVVTADREFKNAGSYAFTADFKGVAHTNRYSLKADTVTNNTYSIAKYALSIKGVNVAEHVYGENVEGGEKAWDYVDNTRTFFEGKTAANSHLTVRVLNGAAEVDSKTAKGTYKVVVSALNDAFIQNYEITFVDGTFTIVPREITVTISEKARSVYNQPLVDLNRTEDPVYDIEGFNGTGNAIANGATVVSVFTLNLEGVTSTSAIGKYKILLQQVNPNYEITFVEYTAPNGTNYYEITAAAITGIDVAGYTGTYDAAAHEVLREDKTASAVNGQTVDWYVANVESADAEADENTVWTAVDQATRINAGTYYYLVKVTAANHADQILAPVTVTIGRATLTVQVNLTIIYGENAPENYDGNNNVYHRALEWLRVDDIYTVEGFIENSSDRAAFENGTLLGLANPAGNAFTYRSDYTVGDRANAAGYDITFLPNGLTSTNYQFTNATGKLIVAPMAVTVDIHNQASKYWFQDGAKPDLNAKGVGFTFTVTSEGTYGNPISDAFSADVQNGRYTEIFRLNTAAFVGEYTAAVGEYAIYPEIGTQSVFENYDVTFTGNRTNGTSGIVGAGNGTYTVNPATLRVADDIRGYRSGSPEQGAYNGGAAGQSASTSGVPYDERLHYALQHGVITVNNGVVVSNNENPDGNTDGFAETADGCDYTVKYVVAERANAVIDWNGSGVLTEMPRFIDAGTYYVFYRIEAENHSSVSGANYYGRVEISKAPNSFTSHFSFADAIDYEWIDNGDYTNVISAAWTYGALNEATDSAYYNPLGYSAQGKQKAATPVTKFGRVPGTDERNRLEITVYYRATPSSGDNQIFTTATADYSGSRDINEILQSLFAAGKLGAGYYRVHFEMVGNDNYENVADNHIFKVERKDITVSANNYTGENALIYGAEAPYEAGTTRYGFSVVGLVNSGNKNEGIADALGRVPVYVSAYAAGYKNGSVGRYDITLSGEYASDNYNVTFENGVIEVIAREVTIDIDYKTNRYNLNVTGEKEDRRELTYRVTSAQGFYAEGAEVIKLKTTAFRNDELENSVLTQNVGKYPIYALFLNDPDGHSYSKNYVIRFAVSDRPFAGDLPAEAIEGGAGTYEITTAHISISIDSTPYYKNASGQEIKYTNADAVTYDGKEKIYKANISGYESGSPEGVDDFKPVYHIAEGNVYVPIGYTPKDAGSYKVTFTSTNSNYDTGSIEYTYVIYPRQLTVTAEVVNTKGDPAGNSSALTGTHYYNGAGYRVDYTFGNFVAGEQIQFAITYSGKYLNETRSFGDKLETLPTFAGTYAAEISFTAAVAGNNYKPSNYVFAEGETHTDQFGISRAVVQALLGSYEQEVTYNGLEQAFVINNFVNWVDYQNVSVLKTQITAAEIVADNGGTTRLEYREERPVIAQSNYMGAGVYKLCATNAGVYKIVLSLNDTDNYTVANGATNGRELTFTIERAHVTVTAQNKNVQYGTPLATAQNVVEAIENGRFDGFTSLYRGLQNGETESVFETGVSYATAEYNAALSAGTTRQGGDPYAIVPSGIVAYNYVIDSYENGNLYVIKRQISVSVQGVGENKFAQHTYTGVQQNATLNQLLADHISEFLKPEANAFGASADELTDLGVFFELPDDAIDVGVYILTPRCNTNSNYDITFEGNPAYEITQADLNVKVGLYNSGNYDTLNSAFEVIYGNTAGEAETANTRFTVRFLATDWQNREGDENGGNDYAETTSDNLQYTAVYKGKAYEPHKSVAGEVYTVGITGLAFKNYKIILHSAEMTVVSRSVTVTTTDKQFTPDENDYRGGDYGLAQTADVTFTNVNTTDLAYTPGYTLEYSTIAGAGQSAKEAPVRAGNYTVIVRMRAHTVDGAQYYNYRFDTAEQAKVSKHVSATATEAVLNFVVEKLPFNIYWTKAGNELTFGEIQSEENTNTVEEFLSDLMNISAFTRMSGDVSYNIESKYYNFEAGKKGLSLHVYDVGQYFLTLEFNAKAFVNYSFGESEVNEIQISFNIKETNAKLTVSITGWTYKTAVNAPQSDLTYEGVHDTSGEFIVFSYAPMPEGTPQSQWGGLSYTSTVPENAGHYVLRGRFLGNADIGGAQAYCAFEITKAQLNIPELNVISEGENRNNVYTGNRLTLNFVVDGKNTFNALTMSVRYDGDMRISDSEVELYATEANTVGYPIVFGLIDDVNYEWATGTSENQTLYWQIAAATDNAITGLVAITVRYGEGLALNAKAEYGGRILYSYAPRIAGQPAPAEGWSGTMPVNAGLYWVKAENYAPENDYGFKNYNDATPQTAEITIEQLTLTATANGGSFDYGSAFDAAKGFNVTFTGFINNQTKDVVTITNPEYLLYHPVTGQVVTAQHHAGIGYLAALATENGVVKGMSAVNYKIVTNSPITNPERCNTVTVTPRTIRVIIGNLENTYGSTTNLDNVSVSLDENYTLAEWDTAPLKTLLGISLSCAEVANAYADVNNYTIKGTYANDDYIVIFADGRYSVQARSLKVSSILLQQNVYRNVTAAQFTVEGYAGVFDATNNVVGGAEHGARFAVRYLGRTNANVSYDVTETVPHEAGNYTVFIALADGVRNYVLTGTTNAPFVIERATIDGDRIRTLSQEYDGEAKTPVIDLSGLGSDFKIYDRDGNVVTDWYTASFADDMRQVGTYSGTLTLDTAVSANYKWLYYDITRPIAFEITAVEAGGNTVTILSVNGWIYDGAFHANSFTATATYGTVQWQFKAQGQTTWTSNKPVNAGTYYVKARVEATANFAGAETDGTHTFAIARRKININITSPENNVYQGIILPATVSVTDGEPGGTMHISGADITLYYSGKANDGTVYTNSAQAPTHAGDLYRVSAALGANSNYVLNDPTYTAAFVVAKATVYGADVILTAEYNGQERRVGDFVEQTEGFIAGLYVLATAADDLHGDYLAMNDTVRTVGAYNVKLELCDPDNYQWAASLTFDEYRRITFTVTPAKLGAVSKTVSVAEGAEKDWIFGENELQLNRYRVSAKINGFELPVSDYTSTIQFAQRGSAGSPTNWTTELPARAGNYFVRVEIGGDNVQLGTSDHWAFTIEKRQLKINVKAYDGVYDENPRTAIYDVTLPDGTPVDVSGKLKEVTIPENAIEIMYFGVSNNGAYNRPDAASAQAVMSVLAGNYYVFAQIAGEFANDIEIVGGNTAANPVNFTIARKTLNVSTVSVQGSEFYYNGREQQASAEYILRQALYDGKVSDYATVNITRGVNAGRYPVTLTFTPECAANFCWAVPDDEEGTADYVNRTLYYTINVGALTVNTPSKANWVYGNQSGNLTTRGAQFGDGTRFTGELIPQYRLINSDPTSSIETIDAEWTSSEPMDAGIYEVRLAVFGTANYPTAYSAESRFTIFRARLELPGFGTDRTDRITTTYNARQQSVSMNGVDTDTMYYTINGAGSYDRVRRVLTLVATDSGEYSVTISIRNVRNYEWNSEEGGTATVKDQRARTYTWTIDPAGENTIFSFTIANWTYGEDGLNGISIEMRFGSDATYSYSVNGVDYRPGLPVDAGTYTIKATSSSLGGNYEEDEMTTTVTVLKAKLTAIPTDGSLVYGQAFTNGFGYTFSGFAYDDDKGVVTAGTVTYRLTNPVSRLLAGEEYAFLLDTETVRVDGVNRRVVVGLAAENYYIETTSGTLGVNRKNIEVALGDASSRFTDAIDLESVTVTVTAGAFAYADETVADLGIRLSTTARPLSDVGGYPISVESYTNTNYNVTFTSGVYTIYAIRVSAEINPGKGVYGGEKTAPVVKHFYLLSGEILNLEDAADYIELEFVYSGTANDGTVYTNAKSIPEKAGTYVATAVNSKSANITLVNNPSVPYIVEKMEIDAGLIEIADVEFENCVLSPALTDNTYNVGGKEVYTVEYFGERINVGRYVVELTLTDFNNTKWKSVDIPTRELSFEIVQGTNRLTADLEIEGWIYGQYNEQENAPTAQTKFGDESTFLFTYSDAIDGTYTAAVPKNGDAGIYYVRVTVLETKNWKRFDSDPVAFEISPYQLSAPFVQLVAIGENANTVYTGFELKASVSGFDSMMMNVEYDGFISVNGDEITIRATNAGTYVLKLSIKDVFKQNYAWDENSTLGADGKLELRWTIARKKLARPTADTGEFIGNGATLVYMPVGFDENTMLIEGNVKNRGGRFKVVVSIRDTLNYEWEDGTIEAVEFEWKIVNGTAVFIASVSALSVLTAGAAVGVVMLARRRKKLNAELAAEAAQGGKENEND